MTLTSDDRQRLIVGNAETSPDWRVIMSKQGPEQLRLVKTASWHVWMLLASQARRDTKNAFSDASLLVKSSRDFSWGSPGEGIPGWRWNGIMTVTYESLWPELAMLKPAHNVSATEEEDLAIQFKRRLSGYLRDTRNVVCVVQGAMRTTTPRYPQWFVRREWNPDDPSARKVVQDPLEEANWQEIARKLTPEEAGEERGIAEVERLHACRVRGCKARFTLRGNRDVHERQSHPDEVSSVNPGPSCVCGDGPFKNQRGLSLHQRACRFVRGGNVPVKSAQRAEPARNADEKVASKAQDVPLTQESSALAALQKIIRRKNELETQVADLTRERDELRQRLAEWEEVSAALSSVLHQKED